MANLKRSEKILGICDERWYSSPSKYLGRIKAEAKRVFSTKSDAIQIELTGEQIMEAIENVEQREKES